MRRPGRRIHRREMDHGPKNGAERKRRSRSSAQTPTDAPSTEGGRDFPDRYVPPALLIPVPSHLSQFRSTCSRYVPFFYPTSPAAKCATPTALFQPLPPQRVREERKKKKGTKKGKKGHEKQDVFRVSYASRKLPGEGPLFSVPGFLLVIAAGWLVSRSVCSGGQGIALPQAEKDVCCSLPTVCAYVCLCLCVLLLAIFRSLALRLLLPGCLLPTRRL